VTLESTLALLQETNASLTPGGVKLPSPESANGAWPNEVDPSTIEPAGQPRAQAADTVFRLPLETARELCAKPDPPRADQLLGPLVVRGGRTIIGGATGDGKSTFALALVAAIVNETDLLGWRGVGGKGLVTDLEQAERTAKRQLRAAGLDESDAVDYCRVPDGLSLDSNEAERDAFEALLAERAYDVVLLDPTYKAHRGDSNDERAVVDLMRLFDRWRDDYGFALIVPTHTRKRPAGIRTAFTIDDLFGSGAFVRGAEVVLGLERKSPGYSRLHLFKDRDGELDEAGLRVGGDPWGLLFSREEGFRRDPNDTAPERDIRAELLAKGADQEWRTLKQWSSKKAGIGAREETIHTHLETLREEGVFEYEVGPAGRQKTAKCWRQRGAPALWEHPVAPGASEGDSGVGAPVLPPYLGSTGSSRTPVPSPEGSDAPGAPPLSDEEIDRLAASFEETAPFDGEPPA
jgi:hypothetical protein